MNDCKTGRPESAFTSITLVAVSVLVAAVALTNQSLWIDEANSALKAVQPSFASFWNTLVTEKGSDLQMPFYMLWLWAWEKVAGHSELALRAGNLPWLVLAHSFLYRAGRRTALGPIPILTLASVNPFLWTYLNEARPYVMQYAAACVLGALLYEVALDPAVASKRSHISIFLGFIFLLCGSSLLGVIWAAFAGAAWLYLLRHRLRALIHSGNFFPWAIAAVGLAGLAFFYLWTLKSGARASSAGRTGLLNFAFVVYELIGSAGWGPGRLEIRQNGLAAFRTMSFGLVPLIVGSVICSALLIRGLIRTWQQRRQPVIQAAAIYAVPPIVLLFTLGYLQEFRILGRHFMPLLPVIFSVFLIGHAALSRRHASVLLALLITIWLGSSVSLRLTERHQKDDYRNAARVAVTALARGESVWWSADRTAAIYYGVPLGSSDAGQAEPIVASSLEQLAQKRVPDLVILSKPDLYDSTAGLAAFLRANQFVVDRELPAFTFWRQPDPAAAER